MKNKLLITFCICTLTLQTVWAQSDSLILKNNDIIIGELKNMDRGVATIETDYSDSDFKIEWSGIKEIYTVSSFLVTRSDGSRLNGTLSSISSDTVNIVDIEEGTFGTLVDDIVYLKSVDEGFLSRLNASIEFGFSLTKANNLKQTSIRSSLGYIAERWSADANFSMIHSSQDEVDPTKRTDAGVTFRQFLPKDWYIPVDLTFLFKHRAKTTASHKRIIRYRKVCVSFKQVILGYYGRSLI